MSTENLSETEKLILQIECLEIKKDHIVDEMQYLMSKILDIHGCCKLCHNWHYPHCG